MDDCSSKQGGDRFVVSRKEVLRDDGNNRDQNAQFCNRTGCNGRPNSSKVNQIDFSDKAKPSRSSFRSSLSGKQIIGSSSGTCSPASKPRKSWPKPRKKLSSQLEMHSSETNTVQDESEALEPTHPCIKIQRGLLPESDDAGSSAITSTEVGSSSIVASKRSRRNFQQKSGSGNQVTLVDPTVSLASKSTSQAARANTSRYGMRNLRCNSVSDVVPSGASSSDTYLSRRKGVVKKRICGGEGSVSAGGRNMSGPLMDGQSSSSSSSISILDSRRTRGLPPSSDNNAASVRTQRPFNSYSRARLANQGIGNNISPNEYLSPADTPSDLSAPSSSHQFSVETSQSWRSSYGRAGGGGESLRSPAEVGNARSLMDRESFGQYNMDGIAEILLALERIEQDEELTYEQLLVLETNFFLNGLSFYDQHRDMRLDIDNMSYEELLALEERMGSVSTALTEEALSECLKVDVYASGPLEDATINVDGDLEDVKCSICQEEYAVGDEVGRLQCEHRYHVACVHQWLRLKNWCPICKAAAAPS